MSSPHKNKSVVILHPHFTLAGGAGKSVLEIGKRMAVDGWEVIVVSIATSPHLIRDYEQDITFINIGGPISSSIWFWLSWPLHFGKVLHILNRYPDSIIFPQVFPANWWGFLYKKLYPHRHLVWMCQEPSAFIHSPAWIAAVKPWWMQKILQFAQPVLKVIDLWLATAVDRVICNSNYTKSLAQKVYHYPEDLITRVYLGADITHFKPRKKPRSLRLITVSRLSVFKNIDWIIEALAVLKQRGYSRIHLDIVGDGEARSELEAQVERNNLNAQVTFHGDQGNPKTVARLLSAARVFVLASVNEPFGIAPVEAMACGTPAVVTKTGGTQETVLHGKTGFHFAPGEINELVEYCEVLLTQDKVWQQLSQQAVKRAQHFTWDKTAASVASILETIKK